MYTNLTQLMLSTMHMNPVRKFGVYQFDVAAVRVGGKEKLKSGHKIKADKAAASKEDVVRAAEDVAATQESPEVAADDDATTTTATNTYLAQLVDNVCEYKTAKLQREMMKRYKHHPSSMLNSYEEEHRQPAEVRSEKDTKVQLKSTIKTDAQEQSDPPSLWQNDYFQSLLQRNCMYRK
jgi:hypothetical protein